MRETAEDRVYRQQYLMGETRKQSPILLIFLVIASIVVMFNWLFSNTSILKPMGTGDPYHCMDCKKLGVACSSHKNFEQDKELIKAVNELASMWSPLSNYNAEITYNKSCDFCNINQSECYGCSYQRMRLESIASEVTNSIEFKTKLCDTCWELGYASCDICRGLLGSEIITHLGIVEH